MIPNNFAFINIKQKFLFKIILRKISQQVYSNIYYFKCHMKLTKYYNHLAGKVIILKSATEFLLKFHVSYFIRNFLSFSALQRILIRFDKVNKPVTIENHYLFTLSSQIGRNIIRIRF